MKRPSYKILLVEDSPEDRFLLKRYFKRCKNSEAFSGLDEAETMQEAVEALQQEEYACVLLDLGLPDGAGVKNVKRLHDLYPQVPLIVFTGVDDERTARSALDYGALDYVVKRVFPADDPLAAHVVKIIEQHANASVDVLEDKDEATFIETYAGEVLAWNQQAADLIGYTEDFMIGRESESIIPDAYHGDFRIVRERLMQGESQIELDLPLITAQRQPRYVHLSAQNRAKQKEIVWCISDRTQQLSASRDSRLLEAIVQSSPDAVIAENLDGKVLFWNHGAERLLGYPAKYILGKSSACLLPESQREEAQELRKNLQQGKAVANLQTLRKAKDGSEIHVSITVSPLRDEAGGLVGSASIVRDVGEQVDAALRLQQAQDLLIESEKLASLGEKVAGLTHEVATPVGVGLTAASTLAVHTKNLATELERGQLTERGLRDFIAMAEEASKIMLANMSRASELMQAFKTVSVDEASQDIRSFDMAEYLQQILLNLRPQLKRLPHNIEIDCPEEYVLYSLPGAWSQILTNLIMNACVHAFEDSRAGTIQIQVEGSGDDHICLRHKDNGIGIDEDVLPQIWTRFYTSKRHSGGSGLGLEIVRNQVERIGGTIEVSSTVGKGTEFVIRAPTQMPKQSQN